MKPSEMNEYLVDLLRIIEAKRWAGAHVIGVNLLEKLRDGAPVPQLNELSEDHRRIMVEAVCWSVMQS